MKIEGLISSWNYSYHDHQKVKHRFPSTVGIDFRNKKLDIKGENIT